MREHSPIHLNPRAPLVLDTRDLPRGPGAMRVVERVVPAPPDLGLELIRVPAGAEIWIDDEKTRQTGPVRVFSSPTLEKGKEYHYTVRARWSLAGKPVEQTQSVAVQGGVRARVNFPRP